MIQVNAIMVWTVVDFQISAENDENCWSMKVERFSLFLFVLWFLFISFYCNNKIHVDFFLHKEFTFYQQSNRVFRNIKIVRSVYAIYSKLAMKTRHCYQLKTFFELFLDVKNLAHYCSAALHEKCPNTEFFLVRVRENTDQRKTQHFSHSAV